MPAIGAVLGRDEYLEHLNKQESATLETVGYRICIFMIVAMVMAGINLVTCVYTGIPWRKAARAGISSGHNGKKA